MGFNNQIIGGLSKLIRQAIQSPNFVTGVSGWSINRDGSAEFHGLTVILGAGNSILVYNGTPALGNLIVAIAPASGADAFGNAYTRGLTLSGFSGPIPSGIVLADGLGTTNRKGQITNYIVPAIPESDVRILGPQNFNAVGFGPNVILGYDDNTVNGHFAQVVAGNNPEIFVRNQNVRFIAGPGGSTYVVEISGAGHDINYAAGGYAKIDAGGAGLLVGQRTPTPWQWGAGSKGKYYYEDVMLSAQSIASATSTIAINLTQNEIQSDYPSCWNLVTGIWTAPDDGIYDIDVGDVYASWVNGSDTGIGIQRNSPASPYLGAFKYVRYTEQASTGGAGSCAIRILQKFLQGDTMRVILVQRTGVAQTINVTDFRSSIRVRRVF